MLTDFIDKTTATGIGYFAHPQFCVETHANRKKRRLTDHFFLLLMSVASSKFGMLWFPRFKMPPAKLTIANRQISFNVIKSSSRRNVPTLKLLYGVLNFDEMNWVWLCNWKTSGMPVGGFKRELYSNHWPRCSMFELCLIFRGSCTDWKEVKADR